MVNKEMLQNTAIALNKIFFATYYCDLETQTFVTMACTEHSKKMLEGIESLPEAFERFIQVLVKPEEADTIREFCNLETLEDRLKKAPYISCDYDSKLGDGWRQVGFLPAKFDENHNVIHALFVIRSLDESRSRKIEKDREIHQLIEIQRQAAQMVSSSEIVAVAVIDKETGKTKITSRYTEIQKEQEYEYEEWIKFESKYVASIDQEIFKQESALCNLKQKLSEMKHFTFSVSLIGKDGKYCYLIHHFMELDDGKHILSVAEDATKWISADMVTNCINRVGFSKRAQITIEAAQDYTYSILCFDVHNFKAINSWYGFDSGDKVLREIADWLQTSKLDPLFICRENADTFFCLVEREKLQIQEIERLCQTRYCLDRLQIPVTLRCGIYHIENHLEDIHSICDKSRIACANCVKQLDVEYCVFSKQMKDNYLDRAYILQNYKNAIADRKIEVFYQPVYDAQKKTIVSAEALVRWRSEEYGLLSPGTFIPTLEQNGHIAELDRYVGSCVWNMLERRIAENRQVVPVALNMSRYDFRRTQSLDEIEQMVDNIPLMKKYVRIEIMESSFSEISEEAKKFIDVLRQKGVKILVDDFGNGYSSLGMLAEFDCDIIKLDMSFARTIGQNPKAEILISSAIKVIHNLGLQAVAEGVETQEQYEFFVKNNCDYIQGYYFSKPVPQEDFEKMLDEITM